MEPANEYRTAPRTEADEGLRPVPRRARIGIVVLTTVLVELALIGGLANQSVSDRLVRSADKHGLDVQLLTASWLSYTWRFTPHGGEDRVWGSELFLILTVVVVSALLVACLLRGAVGFGRAFFGTWVSVVAASLLGGFVRGLVNPAPMRGVNRATRAAFGNTGPVETVVVGSVALGLVVALIVAAVAVSTRRPERAAAAEPAGPPAFADYGPPAPTAPAAMPPWQDQHYGPAAGGPGYPPAGGPGYPPAEEPPAATTRLPHLGEQERVPMAAGSPAGEAVGDAPTTRLPASAVEEPARAEEPARGEEPARAEQPARAEEPPPTEAMPVAERPEARAAEAEPPAGREPAADPDRPAEIQSSAEEPPPTEAMPVVGHEGRPGIGDQDRPGVADVDRPGERREQPAERERRAGEQPTTRFPRPPDDEDLGHIEH